MDRVEPAPTQDRVKKVNVYTAQSKLYPRRKLSTLLKPSPPSNTAPKYPKHQQNNHNCPLLTRPYFQNTPQHHENGIIQTRTTPIRYIYSTPPIKCHPCLYYLPLSPTVTSPDRERSHPSHEAPAPGLNASSSVTILSEAAVQAREGSGD